MEMDFKTGEAGPPAMAEDMDGDHSKVNFSFP
jgi:hypothetical protein